MWQGILKHVIWKIQKPFISVIAKVLFERSLAASSGNNNSLYVDGVSHLLIQYHPVFLNPHRKWASRTRKHSIIVNLILFDTLYIKDIYMRIDTVVE
jgi:hypothetical protein